MAEGWQGWDDYAPFYDWENAQTLARRDVAFWQRLAAAQDGPVLELGCGTGRLTIPVARAGAQIVGIDRSEPMLARARQRLRRSRASALLVRGDIRHLPFRRRDAVRAGDGALRHAAVADARARSPRDARRPFTACCRAAGCSPSISCPICRAGRNTTAASACRAAAATGQLRLTESVRQDRRRAADDLRSGIRRAPRRAPGGETFLADVSHDLRPADAAPARARRLPHRCRARRLRRRPVGRARRRLDHPRQEALMARPRVDAADAREPGRSASGANGS